MNDSLVPRKRILRPFFTPGATRVSDASPPNGQVKIKKHKVLSDVPRTFRPPGLTLSTPSTNNKQPTKLFSIFRSQQSRSRPATPTPQCDLKDYFGSKRSSPDHGRSGNAFTPARSSKDHTPTTMKENLSPLVSSSTTNDDTSKMRQVEAAALPDKVIFEGGHIRQSSTTEDLSCLCNAIPTRTNTTSQSQMDAIVKAQGRMYLDSLRERRVSHDQQQQPTTIMQRNSLSMDGIINTMDRLYPSGWRSPACQDLLDRAPRQRGGQWCDKYRPSHVDGLLDNQTHHHYLRDWLEQQKVTATSALKQQKKQLNMILLVGPHGVGKTAGVFTAAQETGYQVFEIHPGIKRSLKEIIRLVGDMTQNHLVRFDDAQQHYSYNNVATMESQPAPHFGQSLVLLEEVDLVYQSDKGFWTAICDLAQTSKRPIILTCNDTSVIPFDLLALQAVIRYEAPRYDLLPPYLHLICLMEGYTISRTHLASLVRWIGPDLRQLLMTLEYQHHHQPPTTTTTTTTHPMINNNNNNLILQAHLDVLVKQVGPLRLCKSDRIPGAQVTPLCMQLVQNDTGSQTGMMNGSDGDLDLFTSLLVWLNNRSLIDAGVGMTEKRISQVYGLDDYYGANQEDHECGYLHFWKTPQGWDHDETQAHMEAILLEWNHPRKGSGLLDILSWQSICDQRHKQKKDDLLLVEPMLNYSVNSFSVWRRSSFLDLCYGKQIGNMASHSTKTVLSETKGN
ncbi:hypothetical protein [Absidia glauca]|uniref:AAA+ ATPase domain-containing protein n=1 Tax=Absidia glauca TaxID=4829 RepID=A0A163V8K0_ABSGL|nr:hypothetical protein [Absidia glauca]